jgi:hypothetical protein
MKFALLLCLLPVVTPQLHAQVTLSAQIRGENVALSRTRLPRVFSASTASIAPRLSWHTLQPGLEMTEFTVEAGRLGMNVRIVMARLDPAQFQFTLESRTLANRMTGAWNVDVAPATAAAAFNAGQFKETGPWGWLVLRGQEERVPGYGPLSAGIAIDSAGRFRWIPFGNLERARSDQSIRYAFQSYPTLLFDNRVPPLALGKAIDQNHRDARLILAEDRDGRLLILLTRYDALGGAASRVPIGLTLPESIVLAGAAGARHAVMLDGGVSAQLLLRNAVGESQVWKGMRNVPLALIATPRPD